MDVIKGMCTIFLLGLAGCAGTLTVVLPIMIIGRAVFGWH